MEEPVIVGIDPGTTTAYAVLSVDGDMRKADSKRNVDDAWLTNAVMDAGTPVLVGCDKDPAPHAVEKFARRVGAKLATPNGDLRIEEKKRLATQHVANDHERDALAGARKAYNLHQSLLQRIKEKLWSPDVYKQVLNREESIAAATTEDTTSSEDEDDNVRVEVVRPTDELEEREQEITVLQKRVEELEDEIARVQEENERLRSRIDGMPVDKVVREKEHTIQQQGERIDELQATIASVEDDRDKLEELLTRAPEQLVVKKVPNLSRHVLSDVAFHDDEVLFVTDPNVVADDIDTVLPGHVRYVIHSGEASQKVPGLTYVPAEEVVTDEVEEFALVSEERLAHAVEEQHVLEKVVTEYQDERSHKP